MFPLNTNISSPHDTKLISESISATENPSKKNDLNTKSELNNLVSSNDKLNIIVASKTPDLHEKCRSKIELANTLCRKNLLSLCKNTRIECSSIGHEKDSTQHLEFVVHDESDEDDRSLFSNQFVDESDAKTNSIDTNDSQICCRINETIDHSGQYSGSHYHDFSESKKIFSSPYMSHRAADPNRLYRSGDEAMREWYVRYKVRSLGMQLMSGCLGAASSNATNRKPSLIDICNQDDPVECRFNLIIDHVQDTLTQLRKICDGDYLSEHVKRKWNTTRHSSPSKSNYVLTGNIAKEFFLSTVKPKIKKLYFDSSAIEFKEILQAEIILRSLNIEVNLQRELSEFPLLKKEIFILLDLSRLHENHNVVFLSCQRSNAIMVNKGPSSKNNLDEIMKDLKKPKPLAITWFDELNTINKPKGECLNRTAEVLQTENTIDLNDKGIIENTDIDNNSIENFVTETSHIHMEFDDEFNLNEKSLMLKDNIDNYSQDEGISGVSDIDSRVIKNLASERVYKIDNECNIKKKLVILKDDINHINYDVMIIEENIGHQTIQDTKNVAMFEDDIGIEHVSKEMDSVIASTLRNQQKTIFAEELCSTPPEELARNNSSITSSFIDLLTKIQLNNAKDFDNISSNNSLDNLKMTMRKMSMQPSLPEIINEENNDILSNDKQKSIENNTIEEDSEKSRSERRLKQIKEKRKKRKLETVENQKEIYRVVRRGEGYNPLCTSTSVTRLSISNKSFYNSIYGSNITKRIRNISSKKDEAKPIKIQSQMSKHFASKEFDKKKTSAELNTNVKDAQSGLKRHKTRKRKINVTPKVVNPSKFVSIPYTLQCSGPSNYVMEQCSNYNSNDNASLSDGSEEIRAPGNSENIISMYNIESDNTSAHSSVTSISNKLKIKDKRTHLPSDFDIEKNNFTQPIDSAKPIDVKTNSKNDEKTNFKSQIKCKKTIHKVYDLMKQIDKTFQPTKPFSKHSEQNESRSKSIKTNTGDIDMKNIVLEDKINNSSGRKSTRSKEEYNPSVPKVFINAKKYSANTIPSNTPLTSDLGIDKFVKVARRFSHMRNKKEDRNNVASIDLLAKNTWESKRFLEPTQILKNDIIKSYKQDKNKFRQTFGNLHKIMCNSSLNTVHESIEESGSVGRKKAPAHRCAQAEKNLSQIRQQITELRDEVKEAYGEAVRGPALDRIDFLSQPRKKHTNDRKCIPNKKVLSNFPVTGKIESIQTGEHRLGNRSNNSQNYLDIQAKNSVTYSSGDMRIISQRPGRRPQTSPRSAQHYGTEQKARKYHEHEMSRHFTGGKKITQSCPSIPRPAQCFDAPKVKIISASTASTNSTPVQNRDSIKVHSANKKIEEIFKYVGELKPIIERSKINNDSNEDEEMKDCFTSTLELKQPFRDTDTEQFVAMLDPHHMLQDEYAENYERHIFNSGNGDNDDSSNTNNSVVNELISHNHLIPYNGKEKVAESDLNINYVIPKRIYNFSHESNNPLVSSLLKEIEHVFNDEIKKTTAHTNRFHIPKMICTRHCFSLADLSVLQGGDASSILCLSKRNTQNRQKTNYSVHSYSDMLVVPDCVINVAYSTDNNVASGSKSTVNEITIEYVLSYETTVTHYADEFMLCHHMERIVMITDLRPVQLLWDNNVCKFVCLSIIYHCHAKYSCEVYHLRIEYEKLIVFEMISLPRNEYLQLCDSYSTYSVYLSSDGSVEIQNFDVQNSSRSDIASASPSSTTTGVSVICRLPNHTSNNLSTSVHNLLRSELCRESSLEEIMNKKKLIDIFHNGRHERNKRLGSSKMYRPKFENSCCYRAVREYKNRVGKKSNTRPALGLHTTGTNTSFTDLSWTKSTKLKKGVLISFYVTLISTVFALLVIPDVINHETLCEPTDLNMSHIQ